MHSLDSELQECFLTMLRVSKGTSFDFYTLFNSLSNNEVFSQISLKASVLGYLVIINVPFASFDELLEKTEN